MKFSPETATRLGHYVYALVDPRDETIFYVGKASANNRAFDHLKAKKGESDKLKRIREIKAFGKPPRVEILRYGLGSPAESFNVESAIIDAIGLQNLTNEIRGQGIDRGRKTASEVEELYGSKPVAVEHLPGRERYMLFFLNKTYSPTQSEQEKYDSTRQFWYNVKAAKRTPSERDGKLAYSTGLAVVGSVVVRVYSIVQWFPAGTTFSTRKTPWKKKSKWEFVGQRVSVHPLLGKRLTKNRKPYPANQLGFGYIN